MSDELNWSVTSNQCVWCKKAGGEDPLRRVALPGEKEGETEEVAVCSPEHEAEVRQTAEALIGKGWLFLTGILVGGALAIAGAFLQEVNRHFIQLLSAGTIVFGVTIVRLPMVTPQTVELMGLRHGLALGRAIGWFCVAGGVALAVIFLVMQS